jgi:hypothetical protein
MSGARLSFQSLTITISDFEVQTSEGLRTLGCFAILRYLVLETLITQVQCRLTWFITVEQHLVLLDESWNREECDGCWLCVGSYKGCL